MRITYSHRLLIALLASFDNFHILRERNVMSDSTFSKSSLNFSSFKVANGLPF